MCAVYPPFPGAGIVLQPLRLYTCLLILYLMEATWLILAYILHIFLISFYFPVTFSAAFRRISSQWCNMSCAQQNYG